MRDSIGDIATAEIVEVGGGGTVGVGVGEPDGGNITGDPPESPPPPQPESERMATPSNSRQRTVIFPPPPRILPRPISAKTYGLAI